MKELYSIGETARLLGVSVQTLRHYDKMGLLEPDFINSETGYRYYSFNKFHYIDRIKYLQRFGLSLDEIKIIISEGRVDRLLSFLEQQHEKQKMELKRIQETIADIEWYSHYFTYLSKNKTSDKLYKIHLEKRYVIAVPCYPEDELANMEIRLAGVKNRKALKDLSYLRQYGYVLDFQQLVEKKSTPGKKFMPEKYFIYLKEKPDFETDYLIELPAGEYLCCNGRLCKGEWDTELITSFFGENKVPKLVLANEFEDNLVEYSNAEYEIQMLL